MIKVYTAGTFDVLNIGHINIFRRSKALGDYLTVGVSTDELVCSYKSVSPIMTYKERVKIVNSIRYVDKVVRQKIILAIPQLKEINPNIITIGSDWKNKKVEGLEWAKTHGIKVIYLPYTQQTSSSEIKRRIINNSVEILMSESKRKENEKMKF